MYKHDSKYSDSPMTPNTLRYVDTIRKPLFFSGCRPGVAVDVSGVDWSPSLALRNQNNNQITQ